MTIHSGGWYSMSGVGFIYFHFCCVPRDIPFKAEDIIGENNGTKIIQNQTLVRAESVNAYN